MRGLAVFLVLTLLAAGCVTSGARKDAGALVSSASAQALSFQDIVLPGDNGGTEPSIASSPDGKTVYVVQPVYRDSSGVSQATLWRSLDAGRTWGSLGAVLSEYGSNDAAITVRSDGSVWFADFWSKPSFVCMVVAVSRDQGKTWTPSPGGCTGAPGLVDRQWIVSMASTTYLSYADPAGGLVRTTELAQSTDNTVWTEHPIPQTAVSFTGPLVADNGTLETLARSTNYVGPIAAVPRTPSPALDFLSSSDGGMTWASKPVSSDISYEFLPALAASGGLQIASWIPYPNASSPTVTKIALGDHGEWGTPFELNVSGTTAPGWAAAGAGHRTLAFLVANASMPFDRVANETEWRLGLWQDGNVTVFPMIVHRGPVCNVLGNCPDGSRNMGDFFSAILLPDGTTLVAFDDDAAPGTHYGEAPLHVLRVPPAGTGS